jgi:tRNA modification GTPase
MWNKSLQSKIAGAIASQFALIPRQYIPSNIYLPSNIRSRLPTHVPQSNSSINLPGGAFLSNSPPTSTSSFTSYDEEQNDGSLDTDTIVAVVTGAQQGAVSIIRLSGWEAVSIAATVFRPAGSSSPSSPNDTWTPESHRIYYGNAVNTHGSIIDEVLVLVMLGPRSFTAEDVVEIHTHGGGVCAQRVIQSCLTAGARLAKPGEFTLRAFLNGRLDLSQAESVAALVDARTVAAADSALAGLGGGLGKEIQAARAECLDLLVEMDVRLDFDEDLPPLDLDAITKRIKDVAARVAAALSTARQGQLLQTGLQVALVGRPNVGKSSLLNALSGTERAIVTEIAGTTRDVVEAGVILGGIPVTLLDTAGLREAEDKVEKIGVERSVAAARAADVVVMVVDGEVGWKGEDDEIFENLIFSTESNAAVVVGENEYSISKNNIHEDIATYKSGKMPPSLLVINKADLRTFPSSNIGTIPIDSTNTINNTDIIVESTIPKHVQSTFSAIVHASATTGKGLDSLKSALLHVAGAPELTPGGVAWAVNERQAEALTRASEALLRVESSVLGDLPIDFWTIDVRAAVMALGEVSGEDVTEEVLDTVFAKFCIGK